MYAEVTLLSDELLERGANAVSMFFRLNLNFKKDLPIRSSEMGLLIYILKSDTPVTPLMAADYFKVSKPMITTMVNSLCKHGYIEKKPSAADKRSFVLMLSKKAAELVNSTCNEYFKIMQKLMDSMGTEKYQVLMELLEQANNELLREGD